MRPADRRRAVTCTFPRRLVALVVALVLGVAFYVVSDPSPALAYPVDDSVRITGTVKVQVDDLQIQAANVQAEIDALDVELERATEAYNEHALRLDQINVRMTELRQDLAKAQADHAYRVKKFEARLVAMYKSGGKDQLLQILLLSDGMDDLFNRVRLVASLADKDQRLLENLDDSTEQLDSLLREIDENKLEGLSVRRQMDDERANIQAKLDGRRQALEGIDSRIATIIAQEKERQRLEEERLRQTLFGLLNGGQVYSGPLPENETAVLNQFVQTAATYIGIPYVWAGDRPSTGFDCSGFTQYVFAQHGISLPHYSGYQAQMGIPIDLEDIQAGDLVAFGFPVHHVGVYIGDGLFIHAPRTGDVIKISRLAERTNLAAIRRFPVIPRPGAPWVG